MAEFGDLLRQARDFKSVTLREAERATRIRRSYLEALEAEEFAQLPPATYARGIVRNYAQYLGLDPASTLAAYERASGAVVEPFEIVPATRPIDAHSHWVPNFAIIAFMIVMSAVVFAWMYSAYFQREESLATSTVGVATVTPLSQSLLAVTSPQVTVATQGGGFATATPTTTVTPTATVTQSPAEDTTVAIAETETASAVEPAVDAATDVPDADPVDDESDDALVGAHTFVVWVTEEVWVQVAVNGEIVYNDVVPAGAELAFEGDSVAITSGNASFVYVYVDGEDFGLLGDTWDATFVYP
jgi:cytoskeletal protein RodZ